MKLFVRLFFLLALLIGAFIIYYFFGGNPDRSIVYLPYYRNPNLKHTDTIAVEPIPDFCFTNQTGLPVCKKDLSGHVFVVDFFFTTCSGICPHMSASMQKIYRAYSNNKKVRFLSHTVMPETDSVPVLAEYARQFHARPGKWDFVTGSKKDLYNMARNGYGIIETMGNGGPEDFIHTEVFALIDRFGFIRGYYDGTSEKSITQLIHDIRFVDRQCEYTREFVTVPFVNTAINKLRMHGCIP